MRIVVAMSGGVDSSVAAALLSDAGHDVVGLSMQLYDQRENEHFGSCCTLDDLHDARRTAATLDIPHYIVNYENSFNRHVVRNFVNEYAAGRTPIPCVHCNAELKFSHLLDRATALNTEAVATGHYAQVDREASTGRYRLRRGVDRKKDQSYFLFSLNQTQLARAAFPVGSLNKAQVRSYARDRGLPVADKPDSQDICFVPSGDYRTLIDRLRPQGREAGEIVHMDGRVLGAHAGITDYTIGQRRGLNVAVGDPLFVVRLEPETRRVIVGPREALLTGALTLEETNWLGDEADFAAAAATGKGDHAAAAGAVEEMFRVPATGSLRDLDLLEFETHRLGVEKVRREHVVGGERKVGVGHRDLLRAEKA